MFLDIIFYLFKYICRSKKFWLYFFLKYYKHIVYVRKVASKDTPQELNDFILG